MTIFTHYDLIRQAQRRIGPLIKNTPILSSTVINQECNNNQLFFKAEMFQHTKAFKIRGCINKILTLRQEGYKGNDFVAYSTGNHGIALSWCTSNLNLRATVYMPAYTSLKKQQQCKSLGGLVKITATRQEAEDGAYYDGKNGHCFIHPSADISTIAGAGTILAESMDELKQVNAVFAACGGGGLLSGCIMARDEYGLETQIIGAEPAIANDAHISFKTGNIYRFKESPMTVADGLRTLGVSDTTFEYIKKADDIILAEEQEIIDATNYLARHLSLECEPSAAVAFCAAKKWCQTRQGQKVLIILSGGNV